MDKKMMTTATTFGAAMATMAVAPNLQADVVDLSFNPGSVAQQSTSVSVSVDIVGLGGSTNDFRQWNDGIGNTMRFGDASSNGQLTSWNFGQYSQSLHASTFQGTSGAINPGASSGTVYVTFRSGGGVGWFSMNLNSDGNGTISYMEGQWGSDGESLHVGQVPAPAGFALLALGAAGVRRNRKRFA